MSAAGLYFADAQPSHRLRRRLVGIAVTIPVRDGMLIASLQWSPR
jgi:hypothetical protein